MQEPTAEPLFTTIDFVALPLVAVFFLVAVWGWGRALKRVFAGQSMLPLDRNVTPIGFIDIAVLFSLWAASQVLVVIGLMVAAGPNAFQNADSLMEDHGIKLLLFSGIAQLAVLAIGVGYLLFRYKSADSFGLRMAALRSQVATGAIAFIMIFPIIMSVQFVLSKIVPYEHAILDVLSENATPLSIVATWLAAVIAAPLAEEFFFRGVLHNWLERVSTASISESALITGGRSLLSPVSENSDVVIAPDTSAEKSSLDTQVRGSNVSTIDEVPNPYASPRKIQNRRNVEPVSAAITPAYWPIIVSSLFFALVHIGQGLAPIPLFILAVGLGYVFRQTGSFIACWTMHFMLNCYSMLIFTIAILMGETP